MSSAGQQLIAGRIPGERIATIIATSASASFTTTETIVLSITAPLVNGRTYKVTAYLKFSSTVDNDDVRGAMREDNTSGAFMQTDRVELDADNQSTQGQTCYMEAAYTAVATANKTFVVTGVRDTGTGDITMNAVSSRPASLYVDYIEG